MSRTMEGKRGSDATSRSAPALAMVERVQIELGHEHLFRAGEAARFGDRRIQFADDAEESRRRSCAHARRHGRERGIPGGSVANSSLDPDGLADSLDDALGVEEVDGARTAPTSAALRRRRTRRRRPRDPRRRDVNRLPASNRRMSFRSRRRLWAHASTRPGRSDGLRTANFSDSGLAIAGASTPGSQNGALASFSRNAKVADSENPAAVRTCRTSRSLRDLRRWRRLRRRERGKRARQAIEAVVAPDLFDEVRFARDIDAEARNRHQPAGPPSTSTSASSVALATPKPSPVRIRATSSAGTA